MNKLLTRDNFRNSVFERDNHHCVIPNCGLPAVDAHHILERRLFSDGGYYLSNGASVCAQHHIDCERTLISTEQLRTYIGITDPAIPEHLYPDQPYDKWGNPVLPNGTRMRGELFFDASVQKILKEGNVLHLFTTLVKYPRTYHFPWSESMSKDDRVLPLSTIQGFEGRRVIVTEKRDGENTTMYQDGTVHARSLDSTGGVDRHWVKNFASNFTYMLPEGWRVCGENLYAQHSVPYSDLVTYFEGFSIWNEQNITLPWDETVEWFALLGIQCVPVLYDGIYNEKLIRSLWDPKSRDAHEGYVCRLADEIPYGKFRFSVGKFVRKGHVATTHHWRRQQLIVNGLRKTSND